MYHFSDSDSVDSDEGIRYKTDSIRNKTKKCEVSENSRDRSSHRKSHSHSKPRHSNRNRKCSSSDSDSSKRKRYSSTKKRENSSSRSQSEHRYRSEKNRKDTYGDRQRSSDFEKREKILEKKFIPKNTSSSKTHKKSDIQRTVCGPELPEHLQKKAATLEPKENKQNQESNSFGPELPPNFKKKVVENSCTEDELKSVQNDEINSEVNKKASVVGPELPQQMQVIEEPKTVLGPALPPHLKITERTSPSNDEPVDKYIGPSLPLHLRQKLAEVEIISANNDLEEEEEETYGPVPVGSNYSKAHLDLEERALQMKINQLEPTEKQEPVREEWMLELPAAKAANLGLGPRKFRAKAGPDLSDRSSWTDTPQDTTEKKQSKEEPKVDLQREAELREIRKKDKEQEVVVKKSKRDKESLVNIHMKKMKEKKDSAASSERRPFNREVDLQVNRFDEAQKKAVLKKAQLLDTRFSSGESKFL